MAKTGSFKTTVEVGEAEQEVTVDYTFYPYYRGARDGRWGPPIEPDEPAHIEIDSITDEAGKDITDQLDDKTITKIEEDAMENYGDDEPDYPEDD